MPVRVFLILLLTAGLAAAAPASRDFSPDDLAKAATERAVLALHGDVARLPIGGGLTIGDLLLRTGASKQFHATLALRAEQIGGPRWIDEKTCQVQIQIHGQDLAKLVLQTAMANPRRSPLAWQQIDAAADTWRKDTFTATGSISSVNPIVVVPKVRLTGAWEQVSPQQRQAALAAARASAIQRIVDSVRLIPLSGGRTMGDALAVEAVKNEVERYLATRPIDHIDFQDNLQVQVSLAIDEGEFFDLVEAALRRHDASHVPADDREWARVRQAFAAKVARPIGQAPALAMTPAPQTLVPRQSPDWVMGHLESEGSARDAQSKLKAGRAAENDARAQLRAKLVGLPLGRTTLGEAARQDPRIEQAIDRALSRARLIKTTYLAPASATARVDLDLRDLWEELRR